MTRKKGKQLNWSVERRYEFIEFRLFWQGRINRGDLVDAFGVSTQQASIDLNAYIDQAKRNLVYDKRLRTYLRGKHFKPKYMKPDAEEYFAQIRAVDQGLVSAEQSWISYFPSFGCRAYTRPRCCGGNFARCPGGYSRAFCSANYISVHVAA